MYGDAEIMSTMSDNTGGSANRAWQALRQDPALARLLQTILVTGEGGDIIAAVRAMSAHDVIEMVAAAYAALCDEAARSYRQARTRADQWAFWQLILGIGTVILILVSIMATLLGLPIAAASTAATSFVTGSATMWFDARVDENREIADAHFRDMVRYCSQSKLSMQMIPLLSGLDPEQQESLILAVLGLRL